MSDNLAPAIHAILAARRSREHIFGDDLFADPAWDMILDLMLARLKGQEITVSSLCIAAAVPPTTALRWIGVLVERGVFVRRSDETDGRRVFIELSEAGVDMVERWAFAAKLGLAA